MKILFLQYWYDMFGGAETVNHSLANQFKKDGYEVKVLCLYKCGKNEIIDNINYNKEFICDEPKRPSYRIMLKNILKLNIKNFTKNLKEWILARKIKNTVPIFLKNKVISYNPDWIIVTNPEILKILPKSYLKKCLVHIHSNCEKYFNDKNLKKVKKVLFKYQNKVNKLIWLTKGFMNEGKKHGLINSTYMYNPVRIKSNKISSLNSNTIIFIGRIAPIKRVYILTRIFNKFYQKNNDWHLNIYGSGKDEKITMNDNINLMGPTNEIKKVLLDSSIFALTSSSEGFPMVILEAYECGVPVIVFDFKTSCREVVKDGKTGFVIKMDDEEEYLKKLEILCRNKKLRQEMGVTAKNYVKRFYPEVIAKRWYKLFKGEL